jgi:hypothetical protein
VDPAHWAESVPSGTPTASPGGPGQVTVRFPNIGLFKQGVVHLTAVTDQLAWCQAQNWFPAGGAEFVRVRCFRKGGIPAFVPFTVAFTTSSGKMPGGLAYASVHEGTAGVVSSFNSAGLANTVTTLGTGVWRVLLHGPGPASPSGGVQVTAVSAAPAICQVGGRTSTPAEQVVIVRCYDAAGVPMKSGWTLSYQRGRAITGSRPKHFAYTVNNMPLSPGYVPAPAAVNFNSAAGVNSISNSPGVSLVKFPRVGVLPNTVVVTAYGNAPRVCNLNTVWATMAAGVVIVRDVVCYKPTGQRAPAKSFISYAAKA